MRAKELGLKVVGFTFHVGSQTFVSTPWITALALVKQLVSEATEMGHEITLVDIGGGYAFPYNNEEFDFDEFCKPIRESLAQFDSGIQILAEPGRFLSANCITLVHSVVGYAQKDDIMWYYMDEGFYGMYSQLCDLVEYPISAPYNSGELFKSALTGPTCDGLDMI